MMSKLLALSVFAMLTLSCERSNRSIQVQPNNNAVGPGGGGGEEDGSAIGDGSTKKKTGNLEISVKDAPASAKILELEIEFKGFTDTATIAIESGSGKEVIKGLPFGTAEITLKGELDGKAIKDVVKSITIASSTTETLVLSLKSGSSNSGNDTGAEILIDIADPKKPSDGSQPTPPADVWDGASFKGNNVWSIEAVP